MIATFVVVGLVLQTVLLNRSDVDDQKLTRRLARDPTVRATAVFGIWDSHHSITTLQLQVSVSVALGVRADDDDVVVDAGESSFFVITVKHATLEEVDYLNGDVFLMRLNTQLESFGGVAVLSRQARLHRNGTI